MLRIRRAFRFGKPLNRSSNSPTQRWAQLFSKQKLRHAAHVMGPTLAALTVRRCRQQRCPCPRNDGFLRSANAHGNLQNLRHLCRRRHLLRRLDLRRNPHDERTLSGRYSRPVRRAVRCRQCSDGARAGLARSPDSRCEVHGHDQAGRTVTDQSSAESSESQARPRPHSMDGDRIRLRNGFPRWVSPAGDDGLPHACRGRMAHRPQTPKDVSTLGPEPQPEVLL